MLTKRINYLALYSLDIFVLALLISCILMHCCLKLPCSIFQTPLPALNGHHGVHGRGELEIRTDRVPADQDIRPGDAARQAQEGERRKVDAG